MNRGAGQAPWGPRQWHVTQHTHPETHHVWHLSPLHPQNHFLLFVFLLTVPAVGCWVLSHCGYRGFPGGSVVKEGACNAGDTGPIPGWGRSPAEGNGKTPPGFLPGESHGQRSLAGYSPRGHIERDTTEWLKSGIGSSVPVILASVMVKMPNIVSGAYWLFAYPSLWNIF